MRGNSDEKKAAVFILALFLMGAVVRVVVHGQGVAPGGITLKPSASGQRDSVDSLTAQSQRLLTPLRRGEKIDVDRAGRTELTRLPRIGPALAGRIVTDRDARGPFGSLDALGRVSGIGPRVLEELAPHVQFTGTARRGARERRTGDRISLNAATVEQLSGLPGIGPVKAAAIIEFRRRIGRFSSVDDLVGVPGVGPATVERVRDLVRVR